MYKSSQRKYVTRLRTKPSHPSQRVCKQGHYKKGIKMNALVYRRSPLGCMGYEWKNFDKKKKEPSRSPLNLQYIAKE